MKINPLTGQPVVTAYKAHRIICKVNKPVPSADQTPPPQEAAAREAIISKLKKHMEIRTPEELARIEEIRKRIDDGTYHVASDKVAAKIVDEYLKLKRGM